MSVSPARLATVAVDIEVMGEMEGMEVGQPATLDGRHDTVLAHGDTPDGIDR